MADKVKVRCPRCKHKWVTASKGDYVSCSSCGTKFSKKLNEVVEIFVGYKLKDRDGVWNAEQSGGTWRLINRRDTDKGVSFEEIPFPSNESLREFLKDNMLEEVVVEV